MSGTARSIAVGEGEVTLEPATAEVTTRACPNGPVLVRGADAVRDEDGTLHPTSRPVVAVCACAKSQRMPWCDGTHKVVRRG